MCPLARRHFFRSSGQFGPQQLILCWPAGPVAFRSVANAYQFFSFGLSPSSIAPSYRPKTPDWRTAKTICLDKSIPCAHKTMTLHTMMLPMTFTNNFCACQSSPFTDIRLICSVFVEFITSFFHVLTCFNGCVAAMDARLGSRL